MESEIEMDLGDGYYVDEGEQENADELEEENVHESGQENVEEGNQENVDGCEMSPYHYLSDEHLSEEIVRLIINSVEKKDRRISAKKRKRKRSNIARSEANGSEADTELKAYSRCSISYLNKVLQKVRSNSHYVHLVKWMGFGEILNLDDCCVPRSFVQWIANNVSAEADVIQLGCNAIKLSPEAVFDTFGTPCGELLVDSDEELGKAAFLALFGLIDVPSISFFGKKILSNEVLSDGIFCRCFMAVCLGTLFCPNSNTKVSTKYMGALVVVDKIKDRNWSKFIHEWLMIYIRKYLNEPLNPIRLNKQFRTLGGCIYHLGVRCLDFVDFSPIEIPATLPRIRIWKGNLIKIFSDMFMGTNGRYGAYPIKDISQTCYSADRNNSCPFVWSDANMRQSLHAALGDLVNNKLKDDITSSFLSIMKDEGNNFCMKAQDLVVRVIEAFLSSKTDSGNTLKLPCSQECSHKTAIHSGSTLKLSCSDECSQKTAVDSRSTVKLPSSEEDDIDEDALVRRKRTRVEFEPILQHSIISGTAKMSDEDCNETFIAENHISGHVNVTSQIVQSASLGYMLPVEKTQVVDDVSSKQVKKLDISEELKEVKSRSIDLNKVCIEQGNEDFSGFKAGNTEQLNKFCGVLEEYKVQNYASSSRDVNALNVANLDNRGDYLEVARHKYYWSESGISFRLLEEEDDNGTTIVEPELYRPVGMDEYTYNKKIELAILNCKKSCHHTCPINESVTPSPAKIYNTSEVPIDSNDNLERSSSINCAQKQNSVTGLSNTPRRPLNLEDSFIDLISPEAPYTSQDYTNQVDSSDKSGPNFNRSSIVGRRLFEDNNVWYNGSCSKSKSPVKQLLTNIKQESPEVEVLGERSFKTSCNTNINQESPELEVLGEISFKTRCNSMNDEAEKLYNTSLSLGSGSSRYGKENVLPQRIPQRSKYICSPFDTNSSSMVEVQPSQQKIWEAVTTLCDTPPHDLVWAINIDSVRVSMVQLGNSMKENGWVEAWLMNVFCRKLFRDKHPRITNKHFFFNTTSDYLLEKWKTEEAREIWKQRAIESFKLSNKARALHLSDGLYFPSLYAGHWFVFMVDIKYRNFIFLDSFYSQESSYQNKVSKLLIKNFKNTWNQAGLKNLNFQSFGTAYPNVPKQKNGNDCGIFSMKYMQLFCARNPAQCSFSHLDIMAFRKQYAHDILMSDHNLEDDAKFLAAGFNS